MNWNGRNAVLLEQTPNTGTIKLLTTVWWREWVKSALFGHQLKTWEAPKQNIQIDAVTSSAFDWSIWRRLCSWGPQHPSRFPYQLVRFGLMMKDVIITFVVYIPRSIPRPPNSPAISNSPLNPGGHAIHDRTLHKLRGTAAHPERKIRRPLDPTRLRNALHAQRLGRVFRESRRRNRVVIWNINLRYQRDKRLQQSSCFVLCLFHRKFVMTYFLIYIVITGGMPRGG